MAQKLLQYDVLEKLGEGARSVIYAVSDPTTRQVFALKHVIRAEQKDIRFVEQVETEYEVSRQFNHPNLRKSFELKIIKTMLVKVAEAYLVMEMVDGKPLDVRPPTEMMDILDTFIQAAQGLKAMHQMGWAHCDIKPNNILRNDKGHVKVIDFGQACKIGTIKERIQGTPDYIAPEQVNRKPINQQTDVFNLGATLYWNLTGKHIPTLYTVNKKGENSFLLDDRIDTPMDLNPKVPQAVSNLVMDCVSTKQQKRPVDMDAVITRLELGRHIIQKGQIASNLASASAAAAAPIAGKTDRPPESPAPSSAAG
ncbi:MAG: putative serine/threonine protein kinase [Phycisphaerales bacterium]|nr:putative serine/threonine protein kinase [Phycisphaerales bacterium]